MTKFTHLLCCFSLLLVVACGKSEKEKESNRDKENKVERTVSSSERYLKSVENVHKKEDFLKEDLVSFKFDVKLSEKELQGKVVARTNMAEFSVELSDGSVWYYNSLNDLFSAEVNDKEIEQLLSFVVGGYFTFYSISGENYTYTDKEKKEFLEREFSKVSLNNSASKRFFPQEFTVFVEDRTSMLKGTSRNHPLKKRQPIFLQYDKFITVNRIPVSLSWQFFESTKDNLMSKNIGEAKITAISYPKDDGKQINSAELLN